MLAIKKWTVGRHKNGLTGFGLYIRLLDELHSLTSHTLYREGGSGHTATIELTNVTTECNYQTQWSDNETLTSTKQVVT